MKELVLVHLYPREMNIYGDTGNVVVLRKRLQWRGRPVRVVPVSIGDALPNDADILLGGGGQDAAQGDIGADFVTRGAQLRAMADDGVVMLTICGSYQMLGHEFVTLDGVRIPGVGVLDVTTRGQAARLIGNNYVDTPDAGRLVGYENHSGLTTLGPGVRALGSTQSGRGNNGHDGSEGAVRDNVIGTYLHGPVLAKSPRFADDLLRRAYDRRGESGELEPLDDALPEFAGGARRGRPAPMKWLVGLALVAAAVLAGCTSGAPAPTDTTVAHTISETHTRTLAPSVTFTPAPATSVKPLPDGAKPRKGETEKSCPYIKAGLDQQPTSGPNVADIEGDRVYRTTVLTKYKPVGCRFYFAYAAHEAIADILPTTFRTADEAHNAMVLTAAAGSHTESEPNFVKGVDGIRFQTRFYGPDGRQDWAFVFAKGRVMVVVHTQQNNVSLNAQLLAEAVVGKF